jgi:cell filamentation protein
MSNSYTDAAGVFKNKLNLTDASLLRKVEYELSRAFLREILSGKIQLTNRGYGFNKLAEIHRILFQDLYTWAGKPRIGSSFKPMEDGRVSVFVNPSNFSEYWQELEQKTSSFLDCREPISLERRLDALVDIFVELNHIHPFPEGNGRATQVFMMLLAREQGITLDYSKVIPREWNHASAISGLYGSLRREDGRVHLDPAEPDRKPIKKIFVQMARLRSV